MVLDTLQLKKGLERDFTSAQAGSLVRVIHQRVVEDLPTRRDLDTAKNELRAEIKALDTTLRAEITTLDVKIGNLETNLRSEMTQADARLKGEIKDLKVDMARWTAGAVLVNFFGVAGLMMTLIKNIH